MAVNGGAQQCFISHVLLMIDIVYDVMTDFLSLLHYKLVDRQDRLRILNQRAEREWPSAGCCVCYKSTCQYPTTYWIVCWQSKTSADKTKKKMSKSHNNNKYDKGSAVFLVKGRMLWVFFFFVIGNKEMYVQMGNIW